MINYNYVKCIARSSNISSLLARAIILGYNINQVERSDNFRIIVSVLRDEGITEEDREDVLNKSLFDSYLKNKAERLAKRLMTRSQTRGDRPKVDINYRKTSEKASIEDIRSERRLRNQEMRKIKKIFNSKMHIIVENRIASVEDVIYSTKIAKHINVENINVKVTGDKVEFKRSYGGKPYIEKEVNVVHVKAPNIIVNQGKTIEQIDAERRLEGEANRKRKLLEMSAEIAAAKKRCEETGEHYNIINNKIVFYHRMKHRRRVTMIKNGVPVIKVPQSLLDTFFNKMGDDLPIGDFDMMSGVGRLPGGLMSFLFNHGLDSSCIIRFEN